MSHFFERMAQRASGTETRWELRPRALFEPDRASAARPEEVAEPHRANEGWGAAARQSDAGPTSAEASPPSARPAVSAPAPPDAQPASAAQPLHAAAARGFGSPEADPPDVHAERPRPTGLSRAAKPAVFSEIERADAVVVHDRREARRSLEVGDSIVPAPRPTGPSVTTAARRDVPDEEAVSGRGLGEGHVREPGRWDHVDEPPDDDAHPAARALRTPGPPAARVAAVPDTEQLLRDHVIPALQRDGILGTEEQIDLVARPHGRLDAAPRPPRAGRTVVGHSEASTVAPTSPEARPEVHVHIGRVEVVRASPVPPPQPVAAASPPAAGPRPPSRLDLYLEQREAGRR